MGYAPSSSRSRDFPYTSGGRGLTDLITQMQGQSSETGVEFYLRNGVRRWQQEVRGSAHVVILSPFITSQTAEAVVNAAEPRNTEIHTVFSVENFAGGSSSIRTLGWLHEQGCALYDLPRLHAKIVLVPGRFASIGSQNLTRGGATNHEATVTVTDPTMVSLLEASANLWIRNRRPITAEMIAEVKRSLASVTRLFTKAREAAVELQQSVLANEKKRIAERELSDFSEHRTAEFEAVSLDLEARFEAIMRSLEKFAPGGTVPREIAERFIRASAWCEFNPRIGAVPALRDAEGIYGTEEDWRVYQGNSFHVGEAIRRCKITVVAFVQLWRVRTRTGSSTNDLPTRAKLEGDLRRIVRSLVSNVSGRFYPQYDMRFGNHWIDVDDFVQPFLDFVPCALFGDTKTGNSRSEPSRASPATTRSDGPDSPAQLKRTAKTVHVVIEERSKLIKANALGLDKSLSEAEYVEKFMGVRPSWKVLNMARALKIVGETVFDADGSTPNRLAFLGQVSQLTGQGISYAVADLNATLSRGDTETFANVTERIIQDDNGRTWTYMTAEEFAKYRSNRQARE